MRELARLMLRTKEESLNTSPRDSCLPKPLTPLLSCNKCLYLQVKDDRIHEQLIRINPQERVTFSKE